MNYKYIPNISRPESAGHSLRGSPLRAQTGTAGPGEDHPAHQAGRAGVQTDGRLQREDPARGVPGGFPGDPGDDKSRGWSRLEPSQQSSELQYKSKTDSHCGKTDLLTEIKEDMMINCSSHHQFNTRRFYNLFIGWNLNSCVSRIRAPHVVQPIKSRLQL